MSNLETKKTYGLFAGPTNKKLISSLLESGENLLVYPTFAAEKVDLTAAAEEKLKNLSNYNWLIFTDVYAVDFFIELLRELEIDLFELDELRVCAFGEAIADRLRFVQIHADIVPTKIDCETVFTKISEYVESEIEQLKFLVIKGKSNFSAIVEKLKNDNTVVDELAVYQGKFTDESEIVRLKTLLKSGALDEFVFSTAEDLVNVRLLFPNEEFGSIFQEIKISATTENAFQSLLENGLRPLYYVKN